jgi:hypothetical protein
MKCVDYKVILMKFYSLELVCQIGINLGVKLGVSAYSYTTCSNANFPFQCGAQSWPVSREQRDLPREDLRESSSISDVETELFIGPPETRTKRIPPRN